jgi:hypothetical protein
MSPRSAHLRNQADKCLGHATALTDPHTQAELRRLAVEYIEHAAEIEAAGIEAAEIEARAKVASLSPPTLWPIQQAPEADPQPA